MEKSILNDHSRVISGTVIELGAYNITTNRTTMLYLNDTLESLYGSRLTFEDCHFVDSDNGFELYVQIQDLIGFTRCQFEHASVNSFAGSQHNNSNLKQGPFQMVFIESSFYNYNDRNGYKIDSNNQLWFPNILFVTLIFMTMILIDN